MNYNTSKKRLTDFKIACIFDQFTFESFAPECELFQLSVNSWKEQIDILRPDFVFIESAWYGLNGEWVGKIAKPSKEIFELSMLCHKNSIPMVFWNKEDPAYTEQFMVSASFCDYIFTTDVDCIQHYKQKLNTELVYLLNFAAQPKLFNPIEKYERQDKFCFAGSYYKEFPERNRDFENLMRFFVNSKGIDIYDRNFDNKKMRFPQKMRAYVKGSLDYTEIDKAYKGYKYGVNINTIKNSETMFARRTYELMSSNTAVFSNYSKGIEKTFGSLVIYADNPDEMYERSKHILESDTIYRKFRLLGLRSVLENHLYEHRLSDVMEKVFGVSIEQKKQNVLVIGFSDSIEQAAKIEAMFSSQTYGNCNLVLVSDSSFISKIENVTALTTEAAETLKIEKLSNEGFIAVMSHKHYYGANYLKDLCLSQKYIDVDIVCKNGYYKVSENGGVLCSSSGGQAYKFTGDFSISKGIVKKDIVRNNYIKDLNNFNFNYAVEVLQIDEFNFCENYRGNKCEMVDDLTL